MSEAAGLTPRQQELLARELSRRRAAAPRGIEPRPPGEQPPLSPAQRRLWFLDRIAPGGWAYNATLTMRMHGSLDHQALHDALDTVVQRHEALRTVGVDRAGVPEGLLLERGVDWSYREAEEDVLSQLLGAAAREPFDLTADVLLRAHLFRLGADEHVLILVLHHIACDGWSRGILFDEIAELYNAAVARRPHRLPELPFQYGDYARWQLGEMAEGKVERSDEFWRTELAGANFVLDLPVDFPRTGGPGQVGTRVPMGGRPGSGDALRELARTERVTFFMASMAVSGVLLGAICGADDVVLGSPVANRQQPGLEGLIGFFVNTVILRVRLEGDPTFRELMARCRTAALGSLAHQDTPLDRVVELINPKRYPGVNPLFQVNFRMQGAAPPPPALTGLVVERMLTDTGAARFDLALGVNDEPGALRAYVEYASGLFRPTTADAVSATFAEIVDIVTEDPDLRLATLTPMIRERFTARRAESENAAGPGPTSSGRPARSAQ